MKYFEYGKENKEIVVILHGGGVSYKGAEPTAQLISQKYHVILVAYDGFNPSEPKTEFKSAQDEAKRLGDYIVQNYGGHIDILYGLSYGTRILMEVLSDRRLTITTTIADGMGLKDYPNIKSNLGKDIYCFFFTGFFYAIMGNPGPLRKKFLCKVTGRDPKEADRLLYHATWKSWKNQDFYLIGRKTDYQLFERTHMYLWYGIKGTVDKRLSKNLAQLKESGYPFQVQIFPELGHGGLAGEQPDRFLMEMTKAHQS